MAAALTEADSAPLDAARAAFQLTARHDRAEDARAAASLLLAQPDAHTNSDAALTGADRRLLDAARAAF